jgi:hypothetical protein
LGKPREFKMGPLVSWLTIVSLGVFVYGIMRMLYEDSLKNQPVQPSWLVRGGEGKSLNK